MSLAGTLFTNASDKVIEASTDILGNVAEALAPAATEAAAPVAQTVVENVVPVVAEAMTLAATTAAAPVTQAVVENVVPVVAEAMTQAATTAAATVATQAEEKATEAAIETAAAVAPGYLAQLGEFFTDSVPTFAKSTWDAVSPHLPELRNNLVTNNPVASGITIGLGVASLGLYAAHRRGHHISMPDRSTLGRITPDGSTFTRERWFGKPKHHAKPEETEQKAAAPTEGADASGEKPNKPNM